MNFLSHAYLSGLDKDLITGNFIADWVKGKKKDQYPELIVKGITLHRAIDTFTDNNDIYRKSKQRFLNDYHKYSGVITDIIYDHFLAKDWDRYSTILLSKFTNQVYRSLVKNYKHLPFRVKFFLPNLIAVDRLGSYSTIKGINNALDIMVRRTSLPGPTDFAINTLQDYYNDFEEEFSTFFRQVILFLDSEYSHNIKSTHTIFPD